MVSPIGKEHWLTRHLEQQHGLIHTGLWMVLKPVRHVVRRILAYDVPEGNGMYGVWSVQSLWAPLFPTELEDTIGFSTSLNQGEAILISPKSMPEPIQYETFRGYVENTVLPFLRSMDSVERFYREITTKQANLTTHTPHSHFCLHLAMGDFDTARKLLERQRNRWFQKDDDYFVEEEIEQIRKLCRLLDDGNYAAIAQQLHDWEASVAEYSNLEDIWEPTPFPFEPGYVEWLRRSHGRLD